MLNIITNGYSATAAPVIKGAGVNNRHASKRQRAALAAAILEGDVAYAPSMHQLASIFGVSAAYIKLARQFSPAQRKAIVSGEAFISFSALLNPPKAPFALPAPKLVTDKALEDIIRSVGIDRALNAAAAVETHAAA